MKRGIARLSGVLAVIAIAGCGVPTQSRPELLDNDKVQVVEPAPSTTTTGLRLPAP